MTAILIYCKNYESYNTHSVFEITFK